MCPARLFFSTIRKRRFYCLSRLLLWTIPIRLAHHADALFASEACGFSTTLTKGTDLMSVIFVRGLKCRLCGKLYPKEALNFCTEDFGPLEVDYDYDAIAEALSRAKIELRPYNMWRYRELLPIDGEPTVGAAGRRHAAGPGRPPGRGAGRRASSGSRTTPSTSRRCRSRIASSPWP